MVTKQRYHHGKKVEKKPLDTTEQLARLFIILLGVGLAAALVYLLVARYF
ncbi:hypothetical protein [Acetobacteroides hydrogenigenes]|uniref:Uncharacterized protein n=1 Tax=Acetobacteroides hydrogenigenes TaxID=979970 RepID=A0A4R2EE78_9BACT|nr:hypothetical protein [Acetobacteroides hydrogenigenes]TCN66783.1 hypothetical protein CLV25_108122 [Acetobacteroides hydrogenigenes]